MALTIRTEFWQSKPNLDPEERPFQFAVVNVLGREDHAKVVRSLQLARNKSDGLHLVLENAGASKNKDINNSLQRLSTHAFGVRFPDSKFISMTRDGRKVCMLYLHTRLNPLEVNQMKNWPMSYRLGADRWQRNSSGGWRPTSRVK